ncbi:hypothetical protein HPB48_020715 [Haemaphysalis longicornis]|uniref:Ran gtpase-activating protein n=1 Tax=Haemaphysalis longicornis TaxID=44386 RepID=A0A9J6G8L1_HAELO|nr:hypothetical protein HPB48_020715 [Haemaphysalis longicornis]
MEEDISNEGVFDYQDILPGSSIASLQVCTASDGRPCHLLDQITACNKLLEYIQCRLEETTPDELSLASQPTFEENTATEAEQREACALMLWILKRHRCVNSVKVSIHTDSEELCEHQKLIVRSLRMAPALKNLGITIRSHLISQIQSLSCISFLAQLETLDIVLNGLEIGPVLRPLFETSLALRSLELHVCSNSVPKGVDFWDALASCKALNSLKVFFVFLFQMPKDTFLPFFEYLEKTSTLTSVHVALSILTPSQWLKPVLSALHGNKRLVNVTLEGFVVNIEEALAIENFLTKNSEIRSLELIYCVSGNARQVPCYDTDEFGTLTPLILPWLSLLKSNRVLQNVRLNFRGFNPAECAAFLEGVAKNRHLRSVSIEDIQKYCCSLSRHARRNNKGGNGTMRQDKRPEILLNGCEKIRPVSLYISTPEELTWFVTAVLPSEFRLRITSFTFRLPLLDPTQESASAIAGFIAESKSLALLVMDFRCANNDSKKWQGLEIEKTILKAVHRNSSINDLLLYYLDCTDADAEELAYTISRSNTICNVRFDLGLNAGSVFLSHLFPRISCNYTILSAFMGNIPCLVGSPYHNLLNITARNQRLVARAAKFAAGSSSTPCAEAFELVSSNPALVNELCELASVDETEASRMIGQRLRYLQNVHNFMQISVVVKQRVRCHMNSSECLQLDDVDEYSWLSVRRYLLLADVRQ